MIKKIYILVLFTVFSFSTQSYADTNMVSVGVEGKSDEVTRVIKIKMYDNYFEPSSFKSNFECPSFLPFQEIGITLYVNFLEMIFNGNSKNTLKFSETIGYKLISASLLYILNALV